MLDSLIRKTLEKNGSGIIRKNFSPSKKSRREFLLFLSRIYRLEWEKYEHGLNDSIFETLRM
jgi:hypothetical protein